MRQESWDRTTLDHFSIIFTDVQHMPIYNDHSFLWVAGGMDGLSRGARSLQDLTVTNVQIISITL